MVGFLKNQKWDFCRIEFYFGKLSHHLVIKMIKKHIQPSKKKYLAEIELPTSELQSCSSTIELPRHIVLGKEKSEQNKSFLANSQPFRDPPKCIYGQYHKPWVKRIVLKKNFSNRFINSQLISFASFGLWKEQPLY